MNARTTVFVGVLGVILAGTPVLARDPGAGEYDHSRLVRMEGTVVRVNFATPYSYLHISVTGDDGNTAIWTLRMSSVDLLTKEGWSQDSISAGTSVVVLVYRAKDGTHRGLTYSVKLTDGREVFADLAESPKR